MKKIAIISSHPIQYYAPWFTQLAHCHQFNLQVFYLWDFGINQQIDPGFKQLVKWDVPLLEGYDHEFIENVSPQPGTHHFWGLQNPLLFEKVKAYNPNAILLMNYNYASLYHFIGRWFNSAIGKHVPLLFRGDSHRLFPPTGVKAWMRRQWISFIYRHFAACLYVGKANYDYFRYHKVPEKKLFFSPHAVNNEHFFNQSEAAETQAKLWKQELGIPKDHAVILFAGKFEEKKRPLDLLNAFLQANLSQVSLLFVGAGVLEKQLRTLAQNHPNIYFAPFQNQSLMPRTYALADVVVLPSYGAWETWGLSINEAMCMSRAVIVSNHVGCSHDLVHSEQNGLIFPAGDIQALSNGLQKAFSDRNRLKIWGKNSREIIKDFSYEQTNQGLLAALHSLKISS